MTQAMSGMTAAAEAALAAVDLKATTAAPREIIQMKMENDSMFQEARVRRRDYKEVFEDIKSQLLNFASFARTAMYAKPVGKEKGTNDQKYARGLSIKAAEAIACAMGCNRVSVALVPISAKETKIVATYTDFAAIRTWSTEEIVSRVYMGWEGKGDKARRVEKMWDEDRFNGVTLKAAGSRCIREAILRCVPPGLRSELEIMVKEAMGKFLDDATFNKIVAAFGGRGVTVAMLEAELDKRNDNWNADDRLTLAQLWEGIESGDVKADSIGKDEPTDKREPATAKSPVNDLKANIRENMNKVDTTKFMEISKAHGFDSLEAIGNSEDAEKLKALNSALAEALAIQITETNKAKKETKAADAETPKGKPIAEAPDGGTAAADQTGADEVCSKALFDQINAAAKALPDEKRQEIYRKFNIKGLLAIKSWTAKDARDLLETLKSGA